MEIESKINSYISVVHFLGKVFGEGCEIVLQDVQEGRVIAIANGHVSGRNVGAPLTNYALKIVQSEVWKEKAYDYNYLGRTGDNKDLRSSTYFIKDDKNEKLLGMLCINIDKQPYHDIVDIISKIGFLDTPTNQLLQNSQIDNTDALKDTDLIENFSHSIPQIISSLLPKVLAVPSDIPISRLNQDEKIKIIESLSTKGVFKIKGSIPEVAKVFNCSEATVYRYLSKID
ncbi:MAG: transcriptional regulator [Erysipelotrichaceae bacterium]